jgi:hypothetical protein
LLSAAALAADARPEIRVVGGATPRAFEVAGLSQQHLAALAAFSDSDDRWPQVFAVYVVEKMVARQPVAGTYTIHMGTLNFTPRYSLRPGMTYRAVFRPPVSDESKSEISTQISLPPPPPAPPTRVTAIYPSASTLPDNQLRFYIHFSAPMAAGDAYSHVKLVKENGEVVSRAFLEIGEELWDRTSQRLTLLFDPGRVKKGLTPRVQLGPVLDAGQSYRLVIEPTWRDANNQPLASGFEKRFTAGPPIEKAVDSKQWKIDPPAATTREPLVIRFAWPLDRALLLRMITVEDAHQKTMDGQISLAEDEQRWEFRPDQPWTAGKFSLVVDKELEDSAGNNLARPFEVDVFDRVDDRPGPEFVRLPFEIRGR